MMFLTVLAWIFGIISSLIVVSRLIVASLLLLFLSDYSYRYKPIILYYIHPSVKWIVISIICWCWILFGWK